VKVSKRLGISGALACAAIITPALQARTRQGDKFLKLGQKAEAQKDYDGALNYYDRAIDTDPKEPAYLLPEQSVRTKAAEAHITQGRQLQQQQKLDEALVQFQKAFLADPSSQIALQEIRQTTEMVKQRARTPAGTPILTPAQRARQDVEKRIYSLEGPPALRPINNQISSLKMNNQPARVLYESVGKLAGINILFDPSGIDAAPGKNFNLDLNNVTLEEALNYVGLVTHTFWKPISRNAIFVSQETEQKRQEYQDEVIKVFYVQNASSPNEFTDIFNGVRQGAKLTTGVFSVASQNAIVARGTPDTISLVEKLVHDLDKPKSEVMVDVIVMEVARNKTTTLGAALAGQTGGLNVPINFTPRNSIAIGGTTTTTTTGNTSGTTGTTSTTSNTGSTSSNTTGTSSTSGTNAIALSSVGHLASSDFSVSLPGALIQALLTDASTRILQRPQVRVTDNGKASLKIGSKIPYVSGSLNSAIATPGSIPYATTQFQQVDVGTNIDLEPHVNGSEDVSMHIKVEISSVLTTETIAGVQQPVIEQKVNEANIRMKDGEVSVLGGLYDEEQDNSVAGIPGVTNIPLLGYLFGTKTRTHNKDEVLIALIPHIVRAPDVSNIGDEGVLAGSERIVRVSRRPDGTSVSAPLPVTQPDTIPIAPPAPLAPAGNAGNTTFQPQTVVIPGQPGPIPIHPPTQTPPAVNPRMPGLPPTRVQPPAAPSPSGTPPDQPNP